MRVTVGAVAVVLLVFVACGNDGEEATEPPPPTGGTPSPSTPAETVTATGGAPTVTAPPADTNPPGTEPPATHPPPTSVNLLTPVDKEHSLPADYVPPDLAGIPADYLAPGFGGSLRQEALAAMIDMLNDAYAEGHDIRCRSAYRSYSEQESTFDYWVSVLGYEEASRVSAMPGHSEHQLGTTCDLTSPEVGWDLTEAFGATAPGQWLMDNAHLYGFALSYPEGQEAVTGFSYEPWHWRYIGPAEAQAQRGSALTLNQYLLR